MSNAVTATTTPRPSMSYTLGPHSFPTQSKRLDFVRAFLARHGRGPVVDADDAVWILDMLRRHPRWTAKSRDMVGVEVDAGPSPSSSSSSKYAAARDVCFYIRRRDGTREDVSFYKCLTGTSSTTTDQGHDHVVIKALRRAIHGQISEFRHAAFARGPVTCALMCGRRLQNDPTTHVDHETPTFIDVALTFLSSRRLGGRVVGIETVAAPNGCGRDLADSVVAAEWGDFHRKRARLRMTCGTCNLTRPRGRKRKR